MNMFQSVQWLTSVAFPTQHFGNMLLAKLWELVTEVGANDAPRSSLKVWISHYLIFNFNFQFFFLFSA